VQVSLTLGSTTDLGAVGTRISLPFTSSSALQQSGSVTVADASASKYYQCTALVTASTAYAVFAYDTNLVNGTHPFAWATGDVLVFSFSYLSA
jgi:hypothetical protein